MLTQTNLETRLFHDILQSIYNGDITVLEQTILKLHTAEQKLGDFENIFKLLYDGIIVVDNEGMVTMLSDSYADFLGIEEPDSAIGRHCTEVVENSRMHIVIQTGQAEIGHIQRVNGQDIMVMRVPVVRDDKVVGAVGKVMFQNLQELKVLGERLNTMETKLNYYRQELKRVQGAKYSFDNIVGNSEKIREVKNLAGKVAKSRSTILIMGESGTGKELFAHAIHHSSSRCDGPFIRLNCAAIPIELMESELFGYEDGAFTGARKGGKPGKIELAAGGTLFLDEIGDMPLEMQVKLLRVLQEKEYERIGGTRLSEADVRFIAATNRNLQEMIAEGKFREDFYYRLNVFTIEIPPLRDREEDIATAAYYLVGKLNQELGTCISTLDDCVLALFQSYRWPGNIREMENVLERSMNIVEGTVIRLEHLPLYLKNVQNKEPRVSASVCTLQEEVERAERRTIISALQKTSGNKQKAAELLGVHRASLYRKIEKYGIDIPELGS